MPTVERDEIQQGEHAGAEADKREGVEPESGHGQHPQAGGGADPGPALVMDHLTLMLFFALWIVTVSVVGRLQPCG